MSQLYRKGMLLLLSLQNGLDVSALSHTLEHYFAGFTPDNFTQPPANAAGSGSVIDQTMWDYAKT